VALGTAFIVLQVAQFYGLVVVQWDKVRQAAMPILDADGNG